MSAICARCRACWLSNPLLPPDPHPMQAHLPKIELPRGVYPPKVNTWEWSAVTTVSVSSREVMVPASPIAWSISTASCNACLALPSWCPWSILPPLDTKAKASGEGEGKMGSPEPHLTTVGSSSFDGELPHARDARPPRSHSACTAAQRDELLDQRLTRGECKGRI